MRRRVFGFVLVMALAVWTAVAITPAGAAAGKPGAPGKPTAVSGNKQARVSWPAPSNGGSPITIYLVTPYLGAKAQPVRSFHSNKTSEIVGGLTNGKSYTFKVAAHNAVGTGAPSAASKAVTIGTPGAPSRVVNSPGNAQETVAWVAGSNGGSAIKSYIVTPYLGSHAQAPQTFPSAASSDVVTGLSNAKQYSFRVAARNAVGIGPQSALSLPAETTAGPTLSVASPTGHPNVLVDAYGNTVYMFGPDGPGTVSKAGPLVGLWPLVAWSGTVTVGAGLDASKAAVFVQHDGTRQLSYNGHLLYTFVYDGGPGNATGDGDQGFYLLSSAGVQV
jgi:predicted lipoprotein with Yx(FWY)xxD motif